MRKTSSIPVILAFLIAAGGAIMAAGYAVTVIETRSARDVRTALLVAGMDWASVDADGLRVDLGGTAPDEATRFRAAAVAGKVIDADRVVDRMEVETRDPITPPRFSVEILRQADGVTLIGLVPASLDRQELMDDVARAAFETPITDLLEVASYPAPDGWERALDYGLAALRRLERAKVSVAADAVSIVTMAPSESERRKLAESLRHDAPEGIELDLDISAPRPVITPYTLRLVRTAEGASFDACSAPDEEAAAAILSAAREAGASDEEGCTVGLGVPSPEWATSATRGIAALGTLPAGTLTMSNLHMSLVAGAETEANSFARLSADLQADLAEEFTLTATLADTGEVEPDAGPAEFRATRSPEGEVRIRGRMGSERTRAAVDSFAKSRFGNEKISGTINIREDVPSGWAPRVLASLDALAVLNSGSAVVEEEDVTITGTSGRRDAKAEITRILSAQLGEQPSFSIDVAYDERLDPGLALPTPEECASGANDILRGRQITFAPGSATIDSESRASVDAIAELLRNCEGVRMEVAGYTDSQGREEMNQELSQLRAEALMAALMARRVLVSDLNAVGYGEENPIADNGTEEGREANRRIEFRLLVDQENTGESEADTAEAPEEATGEGE